MNRRHFSRLLAGTAILASPAVRAQGQTSGVALVIGNSKYKWEASLPNVKRDAPDIAKRFQELGLKTVLLQDLGRDAMRQAVDKFAASARGANFAAFYFAGHGASWDKDTYLVPEDADLGTPSAVQSLLPVTSINASMKEAAHRLLVFDNCRNNPADGWRQKAAVISSQISPIEQAAAALNGPNTLVLFSTAPGRVALDGPPGENSPFAAAFLRQFDGASIDLQTLAANVRRDLLIATQGRQLMWDQSTYGEPFRLGGAAHRPAVMQRLVDPSRIMELPKAYIFARDNQIPLPSGLISFRQHPSSSHARKIGSFAFTARVGVGPTYGHAEEPSIFIVASVSENNTAEAILSTKTNSATAASIGTDFRPVWRFVTCTVSGERLRYTSSNGLTDYEFSWRDADGGNVSQTDTVNSRGSPPFLHRRFTRLD